MFFFIIAFLEKFVEPDYPFRKEASNGGVA
jgi:hypothetical protein